MLPFRISSPLVGGMGRRADLLTILRDSGTSVAEFFRFRIASNEDILPIVQ